MIDIVSIYEDAVRDNVNTEENGSFPYEQFNRISRRAELRLLDYLTGDVEGLKPPTPDLTEKNRDWVSPFITQLKENITSGTLKKPDNYYNWDNGYVLGSGNKDCEDNSVIIEDGCNVPIELLSTSKFNVRCLTYIKALRPSEKKPIAKIVGDSFAFLPIDIGSIAIEYIRYPVFGNIVTKQDTVLNDVIPDLDKTQNYEWSEFARPYLIYFISEIYSIHTREQALFNVNRSSAKSVRDEK